MIQNLCHVTTLVWLKAAQIPGTTQDHLQIFNIELKSKVKTHQMPEQVCFKLCASFNISSSVLPTHGCKGIFFDE